MPSLFYLNVYGKGQLQGCYKVMWLQLKISPHASLLLFSKRRDWTWVLSEAYWLSDLDL
jgi:hypothetical protein